MREPVPGKYVIRHETLKLFCGISCGTTLWSFSFERIDDLGCYIQQYDSYGAAMKDVDMLCTESHYNRTSLFIEDSMLYVELYKSLMKRG